MIKLPHYRHALLFLILVILCPGAGIHAQENDPSPNPLPVITSRKQVAALVMDQPPPEYPPVAKVNFLQGQVQLELTVNGKGKVAHAHVVQGNAILAASALKAASR